jgi:hypothetical protein
LILEVGIKHQQAYSEFSSKGAAHRNICSKYAKSILKVQRTAIYAAYRDIQLNISVRCTLKTRKTHHCYKYCGALHLLKETL